MHEIPLPTTAAALGEFFNASLIGDPTAEVRSLVPLAEAGTGTLSFYANRKYGDYLTRVTGAVILTQPSLVRPELPLTYIVVDNPQHVFATIARRFAATIPWKGISEHALVDPTAVLGSEVVVGPFSIISAGVKIGARSRIHSHAYLAPGVEIGEDVELHAQVVLLPGVKLGDRVKVFAGSVLGSDGFGFFDAESGDGYQEMPQIGTVIVEKDVRIGARCTIDRGTLGATLIGEGTKIDDQVHIGHNCQVGRFYIFRWET